MVYLSLSLSLALSMAKKSPRTLGPNWLKFLHVHLMRLRLAVGRKVGLLLAPENREKLGDVSERVAFNGDPTPTVAQGIKVV